MGSSCSSTNVWRKRPPTAFSRLLKKSDSCFDRLSTNGKSPTTSSLPPFALSLSKGERRVFQHPVRSNVRVIPSRVGSAHHIAGAKQWCASAPYTLCAHAYEVTGATEVATTIPAKEEDDYGTTTTQRR